MLFSKENPKDELWRIASENLAAADRKTNQSPQPPLHPHPHHPLPPPLCSHQQHLCNIRQPAAVLSSECSMDSELDISGSTTESSMESEMSTEQLPIYENSGCSYESSGGVSYAPTCNKPSRHFSHTTSYSSSNKRRLAHSNSSRNNRSSGNINLSTLTQARRQQQQQLHQQQQPSANSSATTTMMSFYETVMRCCLGNFSDSSQGGLPTGNHAQAHSNSSRYEQNSTQAKELFGAFIKTLKRDQQRALLQAVKSRTEPTDVQMQSRCILIPRHVACDDKPNVIACRLFFWWNLRDGTELKRLPICPSDPKYICCNPLHWCRILETEAPPPYQRLGMERLRNEGEVSDYGGDSTTASVGSCHSKRHRLQTDYSVQEPESFSTEGEDRRSWCKVAYWECKERVGKLYPAEKATINIFADGPCNSGICEEISLTELTKNRLPSSKRVEDTRQKIRLGVTLRKEADGVWLYNRSIAPIFINSPTLGDCLERVYKVEPGYCLKAFDSQRAQSLLNSTEFCAPVGPIDMQSMCISFVKGWGVSYQRKDIDQCPCWLQVMFTHR